MIDQCKNIERRQHGAGAHAQTREIANLELYAYDMYLYVCVRAWRMQSADVLDSIFWF